MTKDQYFEMCQALGSTPKEDEIPVEIGDLPYEVQDAFRVYDYLQDSWDYFNGVYIGKNLAGIKDIFEICGIEPEMRECIFGYIMLIDKHRKELIQSKKPATPKKPA